MSNMKSPRFGRLVAFALALSAAVHIQGCSNPTEVETVRVSLKNTETYSYPTVSGDEEGARISIQAKHYSISEIRRDAETNWVAMYFYRPAPGFVGTDYVEVELRTGSDGASPSKVSRVVFRFVIHD